MTDRFRVRVTYFLPTQHHYSAQLLHHPNPRLQAKPNQPYLGGCLRRLAINACGAASPYRHKVCLRRLGPLRGLGVRPVFWFHYVLSSVWRLTLTLSDTDSEPNLSGVIRGFSGLLTLIRWKVRKSWSHFRKWLQISDTYNYGLRPKLSVWNWNLKWLQFQNLNRSRKRHPQKESETIKVFRNVGFLDSETKCATSVTLHRLSW